MFEEWQKNNLGPLGKTIDEILSHEDNTPTYMIWGAIDYRICQKIHTHSELTDTEKKFDAVYCLVGEVHNGGFKQYFFNSAGNDADFALEGLKDMGASTAAKLLKQAMSIFPKGKPPKDRFKRQEAMDKISSQAMPIWEKCNSEFFKLSEPIPLAYVKKKKSEFVFL